MTFYKIAIIAVIIGTLTANLFFTSICGLVFRVDKYGVHIGEYQEHTVALDSCVTEFVLDGNTHNVPDKFFIYEVNNNQRELLIETQWVGNKIHYTSFPIEEGYIEYTLGGYSKPPPPIDFDGDVLTPGSLWQLGLFRVWVKSSADSIVMGVLTNPHKGSTVRYKLKCRDISLAKIIRERVNVCHPPAQIREEVYDPDCNILTIIDSIYIDRTYLDTFCISSNGVFMPPPVDSVVWKSGEEGAIFVSEGVYYGLASNSPNCPIPVIIYVVLDKAYAPTAFSPNGDGVNDVFRLYPSKPFRLYSRWGELLYEGCAWGGNGLAGVYTYMYRGCSGLITGSVTLVT